MNFIRTALVVGVAVVSAWSCKKSELEKAEIVEEKVIEYPVSGFAEGDGILAAVKRVESFKGDSGEAVTPYFGSAQAFFYQTNGKPPYVDAGIVRMDTTKLQFDSETRIYSLPAPASVKGYAYDSAVAWSVSGNAKNQIDPFTLNLEFFPIQPRIDTLFTIKNDRPFTLRMLNTIVNHYDTLNRELYDMVVVFTVRQESLVLTHTLNSISTQCVFPAAEMSRLQAGPATVEIGAFYKLKRGQVQSVKQYYLLNGSVTFREVEVIK
ncbi:MAG: hypothetical protein V4616_09725 [Bacteroidota bacterium]